MKYGLIGAHLGHSFSKEIHEKVAGYLYELKELSEVELDDWMKSPTFQAINVTIPYKEKVMRYLHHIDEKAESIGSVNTIVNQNGVLWGYNTDYLGFKKMVMYHHIHVEQKKVLILGTGGTAKTVKVVLQDLGASEIIMVSRNPKENQISYQEAMQLHQNAQIVVNTTPCGMYPHSEDDVLLDITSFDALEVVLDVIYNPLRTKLIQMANQKNILAVSGLYMLVAQAIYAIEYFTHQKLSDTIIDQTYQEIKQSKENIVLIGMPSSGKTTIGKILAETMGKVFVDIDDEIEQVLQMPIAKYLNETTEAEFRNIEEMVIARIAKETGKVIATGGGAILRERNIDALRANGKIIFIDRPLHLLQATSNRPLSSQSEQLQTLYKTRYEKYLAVADKVISNGGDIKTVVAQIQKEVNI
ncbi:MAG: hypothetical protein NC182_04290 [Prevotella sp.]|nr:hypothetical protein [Staphylococcus sp.]MCM1350401.1 hypothetical protein [Prevotella sp.]